MAQALTQLPTEAVAPYATIAKVRRRTLRWCRGTISIKAVAYVDGSKTYTYSVRRDGETIERNTTADWDFVKERVAYFQGLAGATINETLAQSKVSRRRKGKVVVRTISIVRTELIYPTEDGGQTSMFSYKVVIATKTTRRVVRFSNGGSAAAYYRSIGGVFE